MRMEKVPLFTPLVQWLMKFGMKNRGKPYNRIPPIEKTPPELLPAREVWESWKFHDFQPQETIENGIQMGESLDAFIASSQNYQSDLLQYSTETYRRNRSNRVTGIFQFDFTDPWPAITWSVVDYWREPKPSYTALRRAMQPVLPVIDLPDKLLPGTVYNCPLVVINDLLKPFRNAQVQVKMDDGVLETWTMDVPANGVTAPHLVSIPALAPGEHWITLSVTIGGVDLVAENIYQLHFQQERIR